MAKTLVIKKCANGFTVEVLDGARRPPPASADYDPLSNTHAFERMSSVLQFVTEQYSPVSVAPAPIPPMKAPPVMPMQPAMALDTPVYPQPEPLPVDNAPVKPYRGPVSDR